MVAVVPTTNSGSTTVWKKNAVLSCITTCIMVVALAGKTCNAFNAAPSNSKTAIPIKTKSGSNAMVSKAIMVEQQEQQDDNCPPANLSTQFHSTIHTEQAKLPANNNHIDRVERWYLDRLEDCYAYSERNIKCPFFRRRCGDILDDLEGFVRFFLIRPYFQDSSPCLGPRISCKSVSKMRSKTKDLSVGEILEILQTDWRSSLQKDDNLDESTTNEKGYYVTGKLSTNIYRDDCEFTSPDPDLPLKGLRKYIGVAAHLFDSKASHSKLLSLDQVASQPAVLKAEWKLSLTLNLPWKPKLSEFTGSTLYFLDEDHLICRHDEAWDISVWDAFWSMLPNEAYNNYSSSTQTKALKCPFAVLLSWISLR